MNYTSKFIKHILAAAILLFICSSFQTAQAQSIDLGADFVSRYIWRGLDYGDAAAVQPHIQLSAGGFMLGTWASYSLSPVSSGVNEHDLYIGYTLGPVLVSITDYYYPNAVSPRNNLFNFDNDGAGAHTIEPSIHYLGAETFPLTFYAAVNAYNDPDYSIYLEAGIPFTIANTDVNFTVGGSPSKGVYTGQTGGAGITNIDLSLGRDIKISDSFSLPIFGSYIVNPYAEQSYLLFGISL